MAIDKHGRRHIAVSRTTTAVLNGEEDLSQWSDAELERGQRKNARGTFTGRKPIVVPLALHAELSRRRLRKGQQLLIANVERAVQILIDVADDPDTPPDVKVKATALIIERVYGRAAERVDLNVTGDVRVAPWQRAIATSIVASSDEVPGDDEIIDAELIEDDE